jgi:tricorn protease-like protein
MSHGYYRFPSIDAHGHLAFTSDSDLFLAVLPTSHERLAQQPILATRLTRGQGCAAFATFSADGERLAFASSHEGGATDVFVMPTAGGQISRLTFEGNQDDELVGARNGTVVCGWHGDSVLYASPHFTTLPDAQVRSPN